MPADFADSPEMVEEERRRALSGFGATPDTMPALLGYLENPYRGVDEVLARHSLPLSDEPHVEAWRSYAEEASRHGVEAALRDRLVQLQFPIREGISGEQAYLAATRRGIAPRSSGDRLALERPEAAELVIHPTMAGAVPVLVAGCRADFVTLVRALAGRNEPIDVPDSMGACLVKGLVNWDRVARHRESWRRSLDAEPSEADWQVEFRRLASRKALYQDRLLLLSRGPYAAVQASDVGRGSDQWLADSLAIRREHECCHYLSWRLFDVMRSNLLDELVADMAGLLVAHGEYRRDLALSFLGIQQESAGIPEGARLELYRGDPPLPEAALPVLVKLAAAVVHNLGTALSTRQEELAREPERRAAFLLLLLGSGLERLARSDAVELIATRWSELCAALGMPSSASAWSYRGPATLDGVASCLESFHRHASERGLTDRVRRRLGLVIDEVLTNIAKYAYAAEEDGEVRLVLRPGSRGAHRLEIEDSGSPFNPLYQPAPDVLSMERRKPGGLGIFLIRYLAASLHYERRANSNVLTVELPAS